MADGDLKWTYTTGGNGSNQTPVIDSRGVIYLYPQGSTLYAVNPNGSLLWSKNVGFSGYEPQNNVFLDYNNNIYVMNEAGLVFKLYSDGTVIWTYNTGEISYGGLSVDKEGIVYALSYTKITAINPDGTKKWDVIYNYGTFYTPASIDNNGNVYASQWGYGTICIDSNGNEKWKREFWNENIINPYATPAISADGNTIYVSGETQNSDNVLVVLNASDGSTEWEFKIVSEYTRTCYASPAIDDNGVIYLGFNDNTVRAINPDGTEKWSIIISDNYMAYYSSPTVALDGTVYFIDYKTLYALNPNDGGIIWYCNAASVTDAVYTSPSIAQDGTIYFAAGDKKLYAIEGSSSPLKDYKDYYNGVDQCYPSLWRNQMDLISTYTLSGTVYNNNNVPISNATVTINDINVLTDVNGYYEVIVESGTYDLTASKECYSEDIATVTVIDTDIVQDFVIDCIECEICPTCPPDKLDWWLLIVGGIAGHLLKRSKKDDKR